MMKKELPTNEENARARLFLRFSLIYLLALSVGVALSVRGFSLLPTATAQHLPLFFIVFALLAAFLTVSKPFLMLLSIFKAFFDAGVFFRITHLAKLKQIDFWQWNACFFLTAFSVFLFAAAAAQACWFSHKNTARDVRLIFSRPFGKYLLEALFLLALALPLALLWRRVSANIPLFL